MRKIESMMCQAVSNNQDWRLANTEVQYDATTGNSNVYLHGNHIATVTEDTMVIFDGGWQTTTTKSRLNALLSAFCPGARVFAKRGEWFVNNGNETTEFESGMTLQWG